MPSRPKAVREPGNAGIGIGAGRHLGGQQARSARDAVEPVVEQAVRAARPGAAAAARRASRSRRASRRPAEALAARRSAPLERRSRCRASTARRPPRVHELRACRASRAGGSEKAMTLCAARRRRGRDSASAPCRRRSSAARHGAARARVAAAHLEHVGESRRRTRWPAGRHRRRGCSSPAASARTAAVPQEALALDAGCTPRGRPAGRRCRSRVGRVSTGEEHIVLPIAAELSSSGAPALEPAVESATGSGCRRGTGRRAAPPRCRRTRRPRTKVSPSFSAKSRSAGARSGDRVPGSSTGWTVRAAAALGVDGMRDRASASAHRRSAGGPAAALSEPS